MILSEPLQITASNIDIIPLIDIVENSNKVTKSKKSKKIIVTSSNDYNNLTVQDLIDLLSKVEDKSIPVVIHNKSNGNSEYITNVSNCKITTPDKYRKPGVLIN